MATAQAAENHGDEWGLTCYLWWGIWLELIYIYIFIQQQTDTTTWSKLPNGKKAIVKQILVSEEREKFSRPGLWESQSGIKVTV